MREIKLSLNDENTSDLRNNKKELPLWKKKLIIAGVVAMIIIIILIIILIAALKNDETLREGEPLGQISCEYMVEDSTQNILLLSNDYQKNGDFDIFVNKKQVKYSKEYKPETKGKLEVQFKLYTKINMDNMFKDVPYITSIIMISTKNLEITKIIYKI